MNTRFPGKLAGTNRSQRGLMLVDCLVYISMFFVVTGLALSIFYRCWDDSKRVRHTADDITAAIGAGERWRADVRQAAGPLRVKDSAGGQFVLVPRAAGAIRYRFSGGEIWRQNGDAAPWTLILARVKSSRVLPDNRRQVAAWRWELELNPRQKNPHMLPLFTFEAVPTAVSNP